MVRRYAIFVMMTSEASEGEGLGISVLSGSSFGGRASVMAAPMAVHDNGKSGIDVD